MLLQNTRPQKTKQAQNHVNSGLCFSARVKSSKGASHEKHTGSSHPDSSRAAGDVRNNRNGRWWRFDSVVSAWASLQLKGKQAKGRGLINWPPSLFMSGRISIPFSLISLLVSLCLEIWLAVLLYRRRAYKTYSVFFAYITASIAVSVARLAIQQYYSVYYFVYWGSELLLILLSLSALNQVFWDIYQDVRFLWWFRAIYYGALLVALGITIRMAILSPPVLKNPFISFTIEAEITANIVRASIVAVFTAMIEPMTVEFQRYPFGIMLAFGISSLGPCIGYIIFSVLGTKATRSTDVISTVSYIVGLIIWLLIFSKPDTELKHMEPPIPPEEMMSRLQGYLKALGFSGKRKK
ncbi:MAG TPA: hypothetical protein VKV30_10830 [Candidatus Angelobacter sp.]|nr:hypothetical protein [Candidatus Angelobacter sp.]